MVKVYTYSKCDTCRRAVKFLRANGVVFEEVPIREKPPSCGELEVALSAYEGNVRRLFNTSGGDYKAMGLSAKLPGLPAGDALALLAGNGNLVKRPFVVGRGVCLVGFDEAVWRERLL